MNIQIKVIILLSSIMYLTVCNKTEQNTTTTSSEVLTQSELKIDNSLHLEKSHGSVLPYQKPGAAVRLLTTEALQIERDESKEVTFMFSSPAASGQLMISVKPSDGLAVENLQTQYVFELPLQSIELPLVVQGLVDGEQTLSFMAELDGKARSMGIVVWVGYESMKEAAQQQKVNLTQESPQIISLPARETVKVKP